MSRPPRYLPSFSSRTGFSIPTIQLLVHIYILHTIAVDGGWRSVPQVAQKMICLASIVQISGLGYMLNIKHILHPSLGNQYKSYSSYQIRAVELTTFSTRWLTHTVYETKGVHSTMVGCVSLG